uniref:tripartite tricarboxylate transporter TctB family protein n=1 Tax=Marinobacterium profundum TaxID=1714300 RepID=UPI0008346FF6|nr:tripartite tricarboxylate transporter TctB family protein [Marinobacterium profundum]
MSRGSYCWTGILAGVIGLIALWASTGIPDPVAGEIGAKLFPQAVSAALILISTLLLWNARRLPASDAPRDWMPQSSTLHVLLLATLGLTYVGLIEALGYALATLIASTAVFLLFGHRRPQRLLLMAVLATAAYYLCFFVGLGVYDPPGSVLDIRALLSN